MTDTQQKVHRLIAEIDPAELACRILEGAMGIKRPPGATALQSLSTLDEEARVGMYRAAENAARYIAECIDGGKVPS